MQCRRGIRFLRDIVEAPLTPILCLLNILMFTRFLGPALSEGWFPLVLGRKVVISYSWPQHARTMIAAPIDVASVETLEQRPW